MQLGFKVLSNVLFFKILDGISALGRSAMFAVCFMAPYMKPRTNAGFKEDPVQRLKSKT